MGQLLALHGSQAGLDGSGPVYQAVDPHPVGPREQTLQSQSKQSSCASSWGLPDLGARHGRSSGDAVTQTQALDSGHMKLLPGGFWAKGPLLGKAAHILLFCLGPCPTPFHWGLCGTVLDIR